MVNNKTRRFTLILDQEMFKVIKKLSDRANIPVSAWVRDACMKKLKLLKLRQLANKKEEEAAKQVQIPTNGPKGLSLFR